MKQKPILLAAALVCAIGFASFALAATGQHEIMNPNVTGATDSASFPTTCYLEADDITNNKPIWIDCLEFLAVDGDTMAGDLTLDDGTGASPSLTLKDATDETAIFSKVDAGFMTVTTTAGDGVQVTTGNLKVGNGTPGVTQDGEDLYVEGTSEFDGTANFDGSVDFASGLNLNATLDVDLDSLPAGTVFYHSSDAYIWYCSSACGPLNGS